MENLLNQILIKHDYNNLETTHDQKDQKEDLNKLKNMLLNSSYTLKEIETLI